jgi:opacity protein-like surface antigen
MRKLIVAAAILASSAAGASAADLGAVPYRPAPMIAAPYDWSGFYWGGNGGWGSSRNCWDVVNPAGTLRLSRMAATMPPAAPPAGNWVFARRAIPGCSGSRPRATG